MTHKNTIKATLLTALIAPISLPSASLQSSEWQAPNPCRSDAGFNDFDFWLGSWSVTDSNTNKLAGTNKITKVENGCLILEHWTSATGGTGQSINYYNPLTKRWRQVWVASAGYSIDFSGSIKDGSMIMEGNIFYYNNSRTYPFRGTWTPIEGGYVRQSFEQFDPSSNSWQPWFDGLYKKVMSE